MFEPYADMLSHLSPATARVPGLAPWLQEAPLQAQVHARHRASIARQIDLVGGEIDFRLEHEVPALLAGRKARVEQLQAAADAAAAAGDLGRALLFQDETATAAAQSRSDVALLDGFAAHVRAANTGVAQSSFDDLESAASAEDSEPADEFADDEDDPSTRAALQLLAEQEADAIAALPHEPLQEDEGGLLAQDIAPGGEATEAGANAQQPPHHGDDMDIFLQPAADRTLCVVGTLDLACADDLHSEILLIVSECSISELLIGQDFKSLRPKTLITSAVLNVHTVLLQVLPSACVLPACECLFVGCCAC